MVVVASWWRGAARVSWRRSQVRVIMTNHRLNTFTSAVAATTVLQTTTATLTSCSNVIITIIVVVVVVVVVEEEERVSLRVL